MSEDNKKLIRKYRKTARWYDFLDAYWEKQYQKIRPMIVGNVSGNVFEAGVGTGRNLSFYPAAITLTAIDLSSEMLAIAKARKPENIAVTFLQADAVALQGIPNAHFDWYVSTFLYCVMPDHLQSKALNKMVKLLKVGGKFRILEIIYSQQKISRIIQRLFAPFVKFVYGAQFNRQTLSHIKNHPELLITRQSFVRNDTYLLIEGEKVAPDE